MKDLERASLYYFAFYALIIETRQGSKHIMTVKVVVNRRVNRLSPERAGSQL